MAWQQDGFRAALLNRTNAFNRNNLGKVAGSFHCHEIRGSQDMFLCYGPYIMEEFTQRDKKTGQNEGFLISYNGVI